MCTANVLDTIPAPLLDRMEVIRLVGYISDEKRHIARGYLEPSARTASGVKGEEVRGEGCIQECRISLMIFELDGLHC